MGTIDRQDWREHKKREVDPSEVMEKMYQFKDYVNFEVIPAGWYPADE